MEYVQLRDTGSSFSLIVFTDIYNHCSFLSAEFCVVCLDDITLGGSSDEILQDLDDIGSMAKIVLFKSNQKYDDPVASMQIPNQMHVYWPLP